MAIAAHTATPTADDTQKLVDLPASGVLTEEEFQAAKRRAIFL